MLSVHGILSRWNLHNPVPEHSIQLPRTKVGLDDCEIDTEGKVHTMTAPDSFRTAAARRYVLNIVRTMIITSKASGMANISYDLLDTSPGRHTPLNGSYTKLSANTSETLHGFQVNELTVERLDGEDRKDPGNYIE